MGAGENQRENVLESKFCCAGLGSVRIIFKNPRGIILAAGVLASISVKPPPRRSCLTEALRAVLRAIARRVAVLLKQAEATEPLYFTG